MNRPATWLLYIFSMTSGTLSITVGRTSLSAGSRLDAVGGLSTYTTEAPHMNGSSMPSEHS